MTPARTRRPRLRRAAPLLGALLPVAVLLSLIGGSAGPAANARAAAPAPEEPTPQTDASVPARRVTLIGATPLESPGETWGIGEVNGGAGSSSWALVRYAEGGWSLGPALLDPAGQPLSEFRPDEPRDGGLTNTSPLAGQLTPSGDGVLVGTAPSAGQTGEAPAGAAQQVVLVRDPGGSFQETTPVPPASEPPVGGETELLQPGERLFGAARAPLVAPLEEAGGHAGAFVVPVDEQGSGVEDGVLHWDGAHWTRESIAIPAASASDFRVLAIGASSPANAWLLAQLSATAKGYPPGAVALFRRLPGAGTSWSWKPVALGASGDEEAHPLTVPVLAGAPAPFTVSGTGEPPTVQTQILTVTSAGVWVDGLRADVSASTTMFLEPEGASASGHVVASWCALPAGSPAGTAACTHELPEPLPTGPSRSIAWANPATPEGLGERVIAGLPEGVSLRLEGTVFKRVLALGGSKPPADVGGTFGAAFSEPREGWLGNTQLPVHLTLHPVASRLTPYPVPFRHALVAIAPQPGAPVGALSSEALAVGDQGQVARYEPGKGWLPESLLGGGVERATPRLRAIAWPTPARAYAVGDRGQMWLWRGETGLWEPDPATPLNFRANLLAVAFDPSNPARGYAVGQEGTLLRYGKTWVQEALPTGLAGATFTAVAFAGSEAIVAYHILPEVSTNRYLGGLLVNNGSGWHVDEGAAAAMGQNVPWAVAGLPDGGAAFTVGEANGSGQGGLVFERQGPGAPWQATPTPLPGGPEPGALALFREGGALRAIASGSVPDTYSLEAVTPPPPGFPPNLIPPYPLSAGYGAGHVLRQTASGWSDEEHELNNVQEPPGNYEMYDTVYQPDPVSAVLINPTGTEGWAVGGFVDTTDTNGALDTADVERYPADGTPPPGVGSAPVALQNPRFAAFAIGGGAQCAAPCADLARARIGPDAWLESALARAGQIAGAQAFFYTGPRVTDGATAGPATLAIPYEREQERYAEILRGGGSIAAFPAASPTDLDGAGGESTFAGAFAGLPAPFGQEPCAGCQRGYYAEDYSSAEGPVRAIVLDDSADVDPQQLAWLESELAGAAQLGEPAIAIGNADLNAQIAAGDAAAGAVAEALLGDGPADAGASASAYFYDAPEENVQRALQIGGESIPTFGSGTLGYIDYSAESRGDFLGASGFLLTEVDAAPAARKAHNRAAVTARLIPNIGELALEARDGTLLRRSQSALFDALARRPRAGNRSQNQTVSPDTDPYIPIPSICVGTACAEGIFPEYTFSSSRPDFGDFVTPNLASPDPHAVLLDAQGEPIPDSHSGLFCAYNAGTTIVTISSGGLSASLPVTVRAGSVRRPCGTQPLKTLPARKSPAATPAPPPAPAPAAAAPSGTPPPASVVPLAPPPPPAPLPSPAPVTRATPAPFVTPPPLLFAPAAFVPLPAPAAGRPAPPGGTSQVTATSSVFQTEPVAEQEKEEEEAIESVSAQAAAYDPAEHEPVPAYIVGVVILAAFAGAGIRRRPRRGRRELRIAPATVTSSRAQARVARGGRRSW